MNRSIPKLALLVPCFNEEEILNSTAENLFQLIKGLGNEKKISEDSFILFVDDGSKDSTWDIIAGLHRTNSVFKGLKLSRNFGHQNALVAGMTSLKDKIDCLISIDADLQDDIQAIHEMVKKYHEGFEIVYGVRKNRDVDHFFKKFSARMFYRLMKFMKVNSVYNHADFRLIGNIVLHEFSNFNEYNLYLRGIFPLIGFPSTEIYYDRKKRSAGKTKYPLRKMLSFAWNGITSFSVFPLRLIFLTGVFIFIFSFFLIIWAFVSILQGKAIPGWASTVVPLFLFGGLQMISLGLIGEYLGKIYNEVKNRPRFIIEKQVS